VVGLVVLFVGLAAVNVVYQRQASINNARQSVLAGNEWAAQAAAREIADAITQTRAQVATLAAQPTIGQAFGPAAAGACTLQFGGAGAFSSGHLDIVRANGTVSCSSLPIKGSPGYRGATWLAAALKAPVLADPVTDVHTGQPAVLVTTPVPGKGTVAAFLDLTQLGPALTADLGGSVQREFVITTADGATVLTRSIQPGTWAGKPVAGTPFAGAAGQSEHRDLDGTTRLYGQATVPATGWRVFAGASAAATFAAANALSDRQIVITLIGLAVLFLAALVLYRRIARPIAILGSGVRAATAHLPVGPVPVAGPAEVAALAEDVNQLLTAAGRELEARSRLAAIVESSADAIWGMTLDGVVTSWNAGAEQILGYSSQEMIGNSISVTMLPDRVGKLAALRGGDLVVRAEGQWMRKDSTTVDIAYTLSPVHDYRGTVTGAAAVARDVTELNRAEADRLAMEHRLRQSERLESLGQLASGIAHDFNNLLSAILNYAAFAAQTTEKPDVRADVQQIQAAAERAARLTRQLLTFARREPAQPRPLNLNAVVDDIQNLLSRSIGAHIELRVELAASLPAIEADRGQTEQVLLNLAINARDAMPRGGVLTIGTGLAELDEAYAATHSGARPGQFVALTVADSGSGMSAEVISHIFDPFFTTKPKDQGTGLGLSTVYGIVTAVGGSISIDSEEGSGTTFRLYFPAAVAPVPAAPAAAATVHNPGQGQTILVVDDEPAVLAATARILRRSGYATLEAGSYEQAIDLAAANQFQLLLTDSVMPQMSGSALADRITGLRPGLRVVYMSGYSGGSPTPTEGDEPVTRIQKPFTPQTLLQAIGDALHTT
jgi:PAS domain S-box-containing protein